MINTKSLKIIKKSSVVALSAVVFASSSATCFAADTPLATRHHEVHRLKHGTSSNWSGYAAYGSPGSFNSVSANWVQPQVTCDTRTTYSSYWVGLDGYNTNTVEQLGTEADCSSGVAKYYAWYEMYPHWGYYINMQVHAGDSFKASVTAQSRNYYQLKITDVTTGRSFSTTQRLNAQRASAEVVVEAPWSNGTLPLANFGTANFTNAQANSLPLGGFSSLDPITMLNPDGSKATPQAFDSTKQNFSVTYSAP